jgi:hypothetical protein
MAANGKFVKQAGKAVAAHPSLGSFFSGPRPYGALAAPTRPGRKLGGATYPALHGLFRAGSVVGVSQLNTIATNIHRGQG